VRQQAYQIVLASDFNVEARLGGVPDGLGLVACADQAVFVGLRVGDQVNLSVTYDGDPLMFPSNVVITNLELDGTDSWFEFKVAEAFDPALDTGTEASGNVYAGDNILNVVMLQRANHAPGSIKDEGFNVHIRYVAD